MIQLIAQLLSWLSIPLAIIGIGLMFAKVFPTQYRLSGISDEYSYERRTLPRLAVSFVVLGLLVGAAVAYNIITDTNGHGIYPSLTRIGVNLLIAHGGYSWFKLYNRNRIVQYGKQD